MTELLDPTTGRTFRHAKLLSTLVDWTTEPRILAAMMRARAATPGDLAFLAHAVKATVESKGDEGLSEPQLARFILTFTQNRKLRRVIATYVSRSHGLPKGQVMRDLVEMRGDLRGIVEGGKVDAVIELLRTVQ